MTLDVPRLKLIADFGYTLSPEHRAALDHWHGRLQAAGVAGELEILSIVGADSDAGGPTVTGTWRSPEGMDFGFAVDHKDVEISRGVDWSLDTAHLGDTASTRKLSGSTISDEDLTDTFITLRNRARIADGWAARSTVRSNDKFRFAIPQRISEGPGHEAGQLEVTAANGDEYVLRMDRGTFEARVYGPHEGQLSDRMAAAFLTDVSESCGGNTDPEDLKYALLYSIEAGTGEKW
ncbi:hypothetical protein [Arthrobacter sp. UYCo732]|uniref:hypothetical protein n=1 Tax=Arthrobacter sp. UYCo732 TaxID=3156336 RepID=UPI00339646E9